MIPFIKAQINQLFKWGIVAVIIAVLPIITFKAVNIITDFSCKTALKDFESRLENIGKSIRADAIIEETLERPCKVNTIYIVDENVEPAKFGKYPLIKEKLPNIKNKGENVFLLENNKLMHAFYLGNTKISPPNYVCADTRHGSLELLFEGVGDSINVRHNDNRFNCGPVEVKQALGDAVLIRNEIGNKADDVANEIPPVLDLSGEQGVTIPNAEIKRSIECPSNKDSQIEITLNAKEGRRLKEVKYIELIDKRCLDELGIKGGKLKITKGEVKGISDVKTAIREDPLIVWTFKSSDKIAAEPISLSYNIDKCLRDCKQEFIKGVLLAKKLFNLDTKEEAEDIDKEIKDTLKLTPGSEPSKLLESIKKHMGRGEFKDAKDKTNDLLSELSKQRGFTKDIEEKISKFKEEIEEIEKDEQKGKGNP